MPENSPLQAGEESGHVLFFRAEEDPAPEVSSQLLGSPFCHSWPVVRVHVQPPLHSPGEVAAALALGVGSDSSEFEASCHFANGTTTNSSPLPQAVSLPLSTASLGSDAVGHWLNECQLLSGHKWMPPVYRSKTGSLVLLQEGWLWSLSQPLWVLFGPVSSGGNSNIL